MIVACLKWVAVIGAPELGNDARFGGISAADQSALEWALRLGEQRRETVAAVTFGPTEAGKALRDAFAAGATRCIRFGGPTSIGSADVAHIVASWAATADVSTVFCGDYSMDRGTGSFPAFLAANLGLPMALGAVGVDLRDGSLIEVIRRLDGGRRERLRLRRPCVISVEGSTAPLRRASLSRTLTAQAVIIEEVPVSLRAVRHESLIVPYRPRARVVEAPVGDTALARLRALTSSGVSTTHGETVILDPARAAQRILEALRGWGYLDRRAKKDMPDLLDRPDMPDMP